LRKAGIELANSECRLARAKAEDPKPRTAIAKTNLDKASYSRDYIRPKGERNLPYLIILQQVLVNFCFSGISKDKRNLEHCKILAKSPLRIFLHQATWSIGRILQIFS
jgi:hypothetical protein